MLSMTLCRFSAAVHRSRQCAKHAVCMGRMSLDAVARLGGVRVGVTVGVRVGIRVGVRVGFRLRLRLGLGLKLGLKLRLGLGLGLRLGLKLRLKVRSCGGAHAAQQQLALLDVGTEAHEASVE